MAETISVDYLIIGAGAMGMAFADAAITASNSATIAIVDRYHRPGGHWNVAYPYVRLHQPSAFYGVNSKHLGQGKIDQVGWNSGLYELATGDEVCAYFTQVMQETLLPSGRVTYFPRCEWSGQGSFKSIVTGKEYSLDKDKPAKIVDATFMRVTVPSMRPPAYEVGEGVDLVTPNNLTKTTKAYDSYTVVGAGKTGIDACLWLLAIGVEPSRITWIMPRDSWLFDRGLVQPGPEFLPLALGSIQKQGEAIMAATSVDDLFDKLESAGQLLRISNKVKPTMFRCATVSKKEFEHLKQIGNIVRQGRVLSITSHEVKLANGTYQPAPNTLYVDCSANALAKRPPVPVFAGNKITLQPVRYCQQVFSAAFLAHLETAYDSDEEKNLLSRPVPHPYDAIDWLVTAELTHRQGLVWSQHPKTAAWLANARLDWFGQTLPPLPDDPEQRNAILQEIGAQVLAQCDKLRELLDESAKH